MANAVRDAGSADDAPEASVLPTGTSADADLTVTVYVVTGRHGILTVPERFCRECNLFVRAADVAAEDVDADVEVDVVSWWSHFPVALWHGGYHPPVMVVGGERLCQGHDVPSVEEVRGAIEAALDA